jgi:hypothetical protein
MSERILTARGALLRLHGNVTKLNASIRTRFPKSHPVYASLDKGMSGMFNDMPWPIIIFIRRAEDAACRCADLEMDALDVFTDGLADLVHEASAWAGPEQATHFGRPIYAKTVTVTEHQLLDEIKVAAQAFFQAVYAIPGVMKFRLDNAEDDFWRRYARATRACERAPTDLCPAVRAGAALARVLPPNVAVYILEYLVPRAPLARRA